MLKKHVFGSLNLKKLLYEKNEPTLGSSGEGAR